MKILNSKVKDVQFGENVTIIEPANIYGCRIGDNCFIGPFTEIQKNVKIGRRTKIQSHSFICELVTIGDDCVIAHGVRFTNDTFATGRPANGDQKLWKKTVLSDRVFVGSGAVLLPVIICSDVVIGAGSVVTKDIAEPGIYAGNPAQKIRSLKD